MRIKKDNITLKREYYQKSGFTKQEIDAFVSTYWDKPATMGEAAYVVHERWLDFLSLLPVIGRFIK